MRIKIYDMLGNEVATLIDAVQSAGPHQVEWNGEGRKGGQVESGYYLYTLISGGISATRKMLIFK